MVIDINLKILKDGSKHTDSLMQKPIACSLCKSENVITDPESGEIVCSKCGAVISDKMEYQGDDRTRASGSLKSRSHAAVGGGFVPA